MIALFVAVLLAMTPVHASTDVADIRDQLLIDDGIKKCFTARDTTFERLRVQGCPWTPLLPADYRGGFDERAAWLRFKLRNTSTGPIERWVEIGHPRMKQVQLSYRTPGGPWLTGAVGIGVPRLERDFVARHYDVNQVTIGANSEIEVLVRVESEAQLALETVVWEPNAFRERRQVVDVWLALAVGAMLLGLIYSAVAFVSSRETFYLMFLLVISGELIIETARTGFMARHLWPASLPMPIGMLALGSMLATLGFVGYTLRMLPGLARDDRQRRVVIGLVGGVLLFQFVAMLGNYGLGTTLWTLLFTPLVIGVGWASFRDSGRGEPAARWIFMSVAALLLIGLLRLPPVMRYMPHYLNDFISPLSTMIVILVVVFGLVNRERNTQTALALSRGEAATKVAFLARMSHEFRTPLDIILGNAQLLMQIGRRSTSAVRYGEKELISILQSGRHLLGLVDEILDYARGLCGELTLKPQPLVMGEFMASVEAGARVLAVRNRNQFEFGEDAGSDRLEQRVFSVDPGRLRQVLDNLVSNACRHTVDGSVRLSYRGERIDGKLWRIHFVVADTGEGIAREHQQRIFQPFERLRPDSRNGRQGAGMGLAVARQLVELMGGSLTVDSEPGRGSTFSFSILLRSVETESAITPSSEDRSQEYAGYVGARRTVLVVDDNLASRATIASVLAEAGFEVLLAEGGRDASSRLARGSLPNMIVTDQFMPEGDGWLVLAVALELQIPCVLVSAAPPTPPADWPRNAFFAATFLKPLDHGMFLDTLGKLLALEWVIPKPPQGRAESSPLVFPTDDELAELAQMLELGEITVIMDWARLLRRRQPEYAAFAGRVEEAAMDLDLDALRELARKVAS